jgi:hypothetical protein
MADLLRVMSASSCSDEGRKAGLDHSQRRERQHLEAETQDLAAHLRQLAEAIGRTLQPAEQARDAQVDVRRYP